MAENKIVGVEERKRNKNIVVDLIVMLVIFAIIAGVIIGVAAMIRYASTKYDKVAVEYSLYIGYANTEAFKSVAENQSVYLILENGSSVNIGKIKSVSTADNGNGGKSATVTLSATCDYKEGLGYFIENNRIVIGESLECRFNGYYDTCVVISLNPEG